MHQQLAQFAELCYQAGVTQAVICPGSRSAPLVFAFNRNTNIKTYVIVDERSAAYIALGMAQQLQKPVALICTSGTAALNFYPAIAEAYYQKIPLIVITADRPQELLNQQDGQMINQVGVYGTHVRAEMQLMVDNAENTVHGSQFTVHGSRLTVGNEQLLTTLSKSMFPVCGPIHINVPLKEPLYEVGSQLTVDGSQLAVNSVENAVHGLRFTVYSELSTYKKILVLVGQGFPNTDLSKILKQITSTKNAVVLADVVSNQHETSTIKNFDFIISQADEETRKQLEPDLLISLGGPVLSKAVKLWLKKQKPLKHIRIQDDDVKVDTYGNVTEYVVSAQLSVHSLFSSWFKVENYKVAERSRSNVESYYNLWQKLEEKVLVSIDEFTNSQTKNSELITVNSILNHLPKNSQLQIANSSSIRYVSYLGLPDKNITAFSNRGTSGIDGCTSTALGAALTTNKIVTLITGDLAFFYDRNAFWNKYVPNNLRIVLLNNNGGGIFNLIDGPNTQPELEEFFLTPQYQSAKNTAIDNGLDYYFCQNFSDLEDVMKTFFEPSEKAKILEVKSDIAENAKAFRRFKTLWVGSSQFNGSQ